MRFALDTHRLDFAASIDAMLGAADVPRISRSLAAGDIGPVRALFRSLADLGVTGLTIDAEHDGIGAEPLDVVVALERLGRWAVPGPVVESLVAVPVLLSNLDPTDRARRDTWLTGLATGDAVASATVGSVVPRAPDPEVADLLLLVDDYSVSTGSVVFVHDSVDPSRRLGDLVAVDPVSAGDTRPVVDVVSTYASLACAAQLLGAGRALLDTTAEYARSRRQFGRSIGTFQAVKHALADVSIGLEMARPLLWGAALSLAADSPDARRDVSAAKVACGDAAYRASRTALQIHGAIGYTREYDVSLWIAKVQALRSAWGTGAQHRRIVLEAL
ncbi:acyl-CoA dehydrogenase family protein [Rhodococcoides kyotonense]|uniref:Acyl-CoA dehydrogenase n=1 Tax=Rhodococcoides kyotonense TaxID=398843 RepID=A0A239JVP6_9NOCA|nr:acyl-CoA dehydrogenase family protein [Rhodococcus kyotonensis]SNT09463.1 Acyl-CoA dehydrogenase [Rhodococcus kyotonensis]